MRRRYLLTKKLFYLLLISTFLLISIISVVFIRAKTAMENFISNFEKIHSGTSTTELYATFGKPYVFYGEDVSVIFSNIGNNKDNDFKVYRFSKSYFFIPVVIDFLIKDNMVYEKKSAQ